MLSRKKRARAGVKMVDIEDPLNKNFVHSIAIDFDYIGGKEGPEPDILLRILGEGYDDLSDDNTFDNKMILYQKIVERDGMIRKLKSAREWENYLFQKYEKELKNSLRIFSNLHMDEYINLLNQSLVEVKRFIGMVSTRTGKPAGFFYKNTGKIEFEEIKEVTTATEYRQIIGRYFKTEYTKNMTVKKPTKHEILMDLSHYFYSDILTDTLFGAINAAWVNIGAKYSFEEYMFAKDREIQAFFARYVAVLLMQGFYSNQSSVFKAQTAVQVGGRGISKHLKEDFYTELNQLKKWLSEVVKTSSGDLKHST